MFDAKVIRLLSPDAMRALAEHLEKAGRILRRRADWFDPPKRTNEPTATQIFRAMPDYVAEKTRSGMTLDDAIQQVAIETSATRERVEAALKAGRQRERGALTDMRIQQTRAMLAAGASPKEIARSLGCTERHARRLSSSYHPIRDTSD